MDYYIRKKQADMTHLSQTHNDRKWEIISSEYLIRRPWLTARRDHVRLPNGAENKEYYVLEYPDWVNVIAITDEGKFLMERQYRHGLQWTGYEICAGVCEPGETPLEAARRELLEETGYSGGQWEHYMTISGNTSTMTNVCHCFVATGVKQSTGQHLEPTEDISIHLLDTAEVRELLVNDEIRQALMAAPLWKYFAEHKLL